jgi:hypothetical protein
MENNFKDIVTQISNEELLIMVYQFEQWEDEMMVAVEDELKLRGILPQNVLKEKNILIQKEDDFLTHGKEATFAQQFLGWIGVLGILGLIIGHHLAFAKTTSKYTGKEYFKYNDASRESGRYMYYISITIIVAYTLYKLANYLERNY